MTKPFLAAIAAAAVFGSMAFGQETSEAVNATIHVYRARRVAGMALHPSIYCDGVELQRLHNGAFFTASLPPGKHMISAGRSEVGQSLNLESGKQYFFRFGHKNTFVTAVSGRQPVTLSRVSEEEARPEMRELKDTTR
jgi:hypothetical protein